MSDLIRQIQELEGELEDALHEVNRLNRLVGKLEEHRDDLDCELDEANAFIAYVEDTNPELRTAFEASQKLEGKK